MGRKRRKRRTRTRKNRRARTRKNRRTNTRRRKRGDEEKGEEEGASNYYNPTASPRHLTRLGPKDQLH